MSNDNALALASFTTEQLLAALAERDDACDKRTAKVSELLERQAELDDLEAQLDEMERDGAPMEDQWLDQYMEARMGCEG